MLRYYKVVSAALLVAACTSGDASRDQELLEVANAFVPKDAAAKWIAPGIPWVQISFDVQRDPLEFAINADVLTQAKTNGWMLCEPRTPEWTGYDDFTVTPSRYTQHRKYMVHKDGVLITLLGVYYSASESTSVRKVDGRTDRPIQHGVVIARPASEEEAREAANSQLLSCDK